MTKALRYSWTAPYDRNTVSYVFRSACPSYVKLMFQYIGGSDVFFLYLRPLKVTGTLVVSVVKFKIYPMS